LTEKGQFGYSLFKSLHQIEKDDGREIVRFLFKGKTHMQVMLLGVGKSGTTAILYKIADGLPNCRAFSGGMPGKYIGDYENAVYKHTYEERKGKGFETYRRHFAVQSYDRKIWMARDPRDVAVSRVLYRFHKGTFLLKKQFESYYNLILQKEKDPASVPFFEICRYAGYDTCPVSREKVAAEETVRYARMRDFVETLGSDWIIFKYEDMIQGKFEQINRYLGFELKQRAEVPKGSGKDKVVRKKGFGDWRHWFTPEDITLFKQAYLPYMKAVSYDCEDWALADKPLIDPRYSSLYIKNLASKGYSNMLRRFIDNLKLRYFARA
jgi:hypothetical protein